MISPPIQQSQTGLSCQKPQTWKSTFHPLHQIRNYSKSEFCSVWTSVDNQCSDLYMHLTFSMSVSLEPSKSIVPATAGVHCVVKSQESALVAFFSDGQHHDRARSFIRDMKEANVRKREFSLQSFTNFDFEAVDI